MAGDKPTKGNSDCKLVGVPFSVGGTLLIFATAKGVTMLGNLQDDWLFKFALDLWPSVSAKTRSPFGQHVPGWQSLRRRAARRPVDLPPGLRWDIGPSCTHRTLLIDFLRVRPAVQLGQRRQSRSLLNNQSKGCGNVPFKQH